MKIAVLVGSLRRDSHNKNLAKALEKSAPSGVEFDYINLNLPLFNQDLEADFPSEAAEMKARIKSADGVLFVTPEHNRSVPGILKNAIDWASRPYGDNSFAGKPAGIVGASIGSIGTAVAQSDLRHVVPYLEMKLMGQPEVYMGKAGDLFDEQGNLLDERWRKNLEVYMSTFVHWIRNEA